MTGNPAKAKPKRLLQFERSLEPLLPKETFIRRLLRHSGFALAFLFLSLAIGMIGYHLLARLAWIDAFLNASMILTGMGPVNKMVTPAAKIFSGFYALYSGIAFLSAVGVIFAPIIHRAIHKFHLGQ